MKTKNITLLKQFQSPIERAKTGVRIKTDRLEIRMMCQSGATCLHPQCCFCEL